MIAQPGCQNGDTIRDYVLCFMEIAPENPVERSFELLIGEGIAEWINGTVGITEEIREVEKMVIHAVAFFPAKSFHERAYMIWSPTNHERA